MYAIFSERNPNFTQAVLHISNSSDAIFLLRSDWPSIRARVGVRNKINLFRKAGSTIGVVSFKLNKKLITYRQITEELTVSRLCTDL